MLPGRKEGHVGDDAVEGGHRWSHTSHMTRHWQTGGEGCPGLDVVHPEPQRGLVEVGGGLIADPDVQRDVLRPEDGFHVLLGRDGGAGQLIGAGRRAAPPPEKKKTRKKKDKHRLMPTKSKFTHRKWAVEEESIQEWEFWSQDSGVGHPLPLQPTKPQTPRPKTLRGPAQAPSSAAWRCPACGACGARRGT